MTISWSRQMADTVGYRAGMEWMKLANNVSQSSLKAIWNYVRGARLRGSIRLPKDLSIPSSSDKFIQT